jgi:hypothetical protein
VATSFSASYSGMQTILMAFLSSSKNIRHVLKQAKATSFDILSNSSFESPFHFMYS